MAWKRWRMSKRDSKHAYRGRGYYVLCGAGSRIWWHQVLWQKNLVTMLDWDQSTMVLGDGLKDIYG